MKKHFSVAVLGGDKRQESIAEYFAINGVNVFIWGVELHIENENLFRCTTWQEALHNSQAVVLPLPVSDDDIHLRMSENLQNSTIRLDAILQQIQPTQLVFGGLLSARFSEKLKENSISFFDYFNSETVQLKNALLTAEGAILLGMQALPVSIDQSHFAVIGYGRIGELLAKRLIALGATVTVYARREDALTRASFERCQVQRLSIEDDYASLKGIDRETVVVYNTVPEIIFTANRLECFPQSTLFIELASFPGGIDRAVAKQKGIPILHGNSLPGKYAPKSAGYVLAESIKSMLIQYPTTKQYFME